MIKYEEKLIKILKKSEKIALSFKHNYIGTEHFILSVLEDKSEISNILKRVINKEIFINDISTYIKITNNKNFPIYTPLLKNIIIDSIKNNEIKFKDVLLNILKCNEGIAISILNKNNINIDNIINKIQNNNEIKYGSNVNKRVKNKNYIPIIGRDKELKELIEILCKKNKNNAILIGEAGVGKTAIIEQLAYMINNNNVPDNLKNKIIIEINMSSIVSGTRYRGDFEEKIEKIIEEFQNNDNYILFIDEIHTIKGAGASEGAIDASNILKPYLARNKIKCIGATTKDEYNATIKKDKALYRRFQTITIEEPTEKDTLNILKNIKKHYESYHNVIINNKILTNIIKIANNDKTKNNPDKSIELLDLICVKSKLNSNNTSIDDLISKKNKYLKEKDFKNAKLIDKEILNFEKNKIKINKNILLELSNCNNNNKILGFKL